MQLHFGFTALAGLAVLAAASATPATNAQCSSGGNYAPQYGGSAYYAPAPSPTYYAPSYAAPQYCAPPVYYSQPTYRSYSLNVGIRHGRHDSHGGYSTRYDRHDRRDRRNDRGHRTQRRHRD